MNQFDIIFCKCPCHRAWGSIYPPICICNCYGLKTTISAPTTVPIPNSFSKKENLPCSCKCHIDFPFNYYCPDCDGASDSQGNWVHHGGYSKGSTKWNQIINELFENCACNFKGKCSAEICRQISKRRMTLMKKIHELECELKAKDLEVMKLKYEYEQSIKQ